MKDLLLYARLGKAMSVRFPEFITGYLVNARICQGCAVGHIYKDLSGFPDGTLMTSEEITELSEYRGRWIIKTRCHDCFVVVNFSLRGGRKSIVQLADMFESAAAIQSRWCMH